VGVCGFYFEEEAVGDAVLLPVLFAEAELGVAHVLELAGEHEVLVVGVGVEVDDEVAREGTEFYEEVVL
jgi:hypothetical protein